MTTVAGGSAGVQMGRGVNAVGGMRGPVATAISADASTSRPGSSPVAWASVPSPVDELLLTSVDGALRSVWFSPHRTTPRPSMIEQLTASGAVHAPDEPVLAEAAAQLAAYFAGRLREFDLPLAPRGSSFQLEVWAALRTIPYGETWSYGELAEVIGRGPAASRAVGLANGANPISIVVPCHRVIGADGSLTGFGGGLPRKQYLLELESPSLFTA